MSLQSSSIKSEPSRYRKPREVDEFILLSPLLPPDVKIYS